MALEPITNTPKRLVFQRILPLICPDCRISVSRGVAEGRISAKSADALVVLFDRQLDEIHMSGPGCGGCHYGCRGRDVYYQAEMGDDAWGLKELGCRTALDGSRVAISELMSLALARVAKSEFCITHVELTHGAVSDWMEQHPALAQDFRKSMSDGI